MEINSTLNKQEITLAKGFVSYYIKHKEKKIELLLKKEKIMGNKVFII